MTVRHALIVAFHYPPEASSSGVLRTLKYSQYLPDHGWRVSVVTTRPSAYSAQDPALEASVPPGTQVIRTRYFNTKRHFSLAGKYPALFALPDVWIGWWPWAVAAARRLIRRDPPDVVYSTSPHATAHLIAMTVARLAHIPWVADFRDPWIEDSPEPGSPNGRLYRLLNRALERKVVERSDVVVASTAALRDALGSRYGNLKKMIVAIPNGYDESDFATEKKEAAHRYPRLRIIHAGMTNRDFRDPRPLFEALGRLIGVGIVAAVELDIRFIGGGDYADSEEVRHAAQQAGLEGAYVNVPRMSYREALEEVRGADILLLLQASADTVSLVPAKLYEYLRAQKPTLALVPSGASQEILHDAEGGWAVDPSNAERLVAILTEIIQKWRMGTLHEHRADLSRLKRFERRTLAGELAEIFNTVCHASARRRNPA